MPFIAAQLVLLTAIPTPAQADDFPPEVAERGGTLKLEPAAPWNIDFGENRCILSRVFNSEFGRHVVFFEQSAPSPHFGMTLAGDRIRQFPRGTFTKIGMRNDMPLRSTSGNIFGSVPDIGPAMIFPAMSLGPAQARKDEEPAQLIGAGIDLESAGMVDRVILKLGSRAVSFETGNLAAPMQALNVCALDLLSGWGLDPEQHTSYTPPKWLNAEEIFERLERSYPREALYRNERGIFQVRVIVEKDGTVSDCHAEKSSETDYLETPACEEMANARFEPARDQDGMPMRSFFSNSLTYVGYQ